DPIEIQFRLRQASLRLGDLRLGRAGPGISFITDSARLVNDCLKLTGPNASERRTGGHWSPRFQWPEPALRHFPLVELDKIAGNPKREVHLGVRCYGRRIPHRLRSLRQLDNSHANGLRRRIAITLRGTLVISTPSNQQNGCSEQKVCDETR